LTGDPDTILCRIDIREQSQDAVAVGRPSGKCINVRKIIARAPSGRTASLLEWTEASEVELPLSRVRGETIVEELCRALRIGAEDGSQAVAIRPCGLVDAGHAIRDWTIGDVFVKGRAGLLALEQKGDVIFWKRKGRAREKYDVACLEVSAEFATTPGIRRTLDGYQVAHAPSWALRCGWSRRGGHQKEYSGWRNRLQARRRRCASGIANSWDSKLRLRLEDHNGLIGTRNNRFGDGDQSVLLTEHTQSWRTRFATVELRCSAR